MARTRAEILRSLDIGRGEFVVDIGGGHRPLPRADVVFEKYPFEEQHRVAPPVHVAPVLIADAVRMPVPDGGAALVIASHIIEHLPDPGAFVRELQRCGDRVYLEVPSLQRELMFAWPFHEWFVEIRGSHLTFYRDDMPQLFGDFFHRGYDALADAWHLQRHEQLNQWYYGPTRDLTWEIAETSAFQLALERSARGPDRVSEATVERVPYSLRQLAVLAAQRLLPDGLVRGLRRTAPRAPNEPRPVASTLVERLMCLECSAAQLRLQKAEIRCGACGASYVKRGGLFDFDRPVTARATVSR